MNKPLRTILIALGFAFIWVGFFCSFELNEQKKAAVESATPDVPVEGFETYTLENNEYVGEYSPQTEFMLLNQTDSSFLLRQEEPAVNRVNAAGFAKEFDLMEQEQSSSFLPALLIISGVAFLCFGFASLCLKKSFGSKPAHP